MMQQILYMHWMTASLFPEMVTALSVEFGSISLATWIEAPVISRISLILDPPFPIRDPHWEAGTISRKVIGGRGTVPGERRLLRSSSNLLHMSVNALKIDSVFPVTVTILSGQLPSLILILAPLSSRNLFTMSPFFPMMLPTSFPCMMSLIVRVILGLSVVGLSREAILGRL